MPGFAIRAATDADTPQILSFIEALQAYEHGLEPNRRRDSSFAEEHLAVLNRQLATQQGCAFLAQSGAAAIGWAAFYVVESDIFIVEAERRHGYIAELYVVEDWRGKGVGRALMAACEAETRALDLPLITINVLAGNKNAAMRYVEAGFAPYATELRKYLKGPQKP